MNDETQAAVSLNLMKEFIAPIEKETGLGGRFWKEIIFSRVSNRTLDPPVRCIATLPTVTLTAAGATYLRCPISASWQISRKNFRWKSTQLVEFEDIAPRSWSLSSWLTCSWSCRLHSPRISGRRSARALCGRVLGGPRGTDRLLWIPRTETRTQANSYIEG